MTLSLLQYVLGGAAGSLVGFSLGLVGGGGIETDAQCA